MILINHRKNFKKTVLALLVSLSVCQTAFALQEVSDEALSQTTGEGIALLPTDFSFQFNGANSTASTSTTKTDIIDNSNPGTGYIHIIPVGPLSSTIQDYNQKNPNSQIGKADIYLYGLALSKNDNNVNTRYSGTNISSWGTAANPWVIKVATAANIPNFSGVSNNISYLNIEMPVYSINGTSDDYNMKLGTWMDAFVRDPSKIENDMAEFCLNAKATCKTNSNDIIANRFRAQAIWNGLSTNGSQLKIFQTQSGSASTSYNNTLGMAGLIRLNTLSNIASGTIVVTDLDSDGRRQKNADGTIKTKNINVTRNTTNDNGVLRLSTQETPQSFSASKILNTPAIDGGGVPTFNANEGLYLYNPHINLVLGSLYQPVILDVAPDGKNIVLEVTRIPNNANVYNQIYTDYDNPSSSTLKGSTCSQFECGSADGSKNPTHSSITVGDVGFNPATKTISADMSLNSKGITFKNTDASVVTNLGSAAIDGVLIQHFKITTKGL